MSDIAERLRRHYDSARDLQFIASEAADEIERLRAALQQALTYLNEIPPRWKDARRALEGGK